MIHDLHLGVFGREREVVARRLRLSLSWKVYLVAMAVYMHQQTWAFWRFHAVSGCRLFLLGPRSALQ